MCGCGLDGGRVGLWVARGVVLLGASCCRVRCSGAGLRCVTRPPAPVPALCSTAGSYPFVLADLVRQHVQLPSWDRSFAMGHSAPAWHALPWLLISVALLPGPENCNRYTVECWLEGEEGRTGYPESGIRTEHTARRVHQRTASNSTRSASARRRSRGWPKRRAAERSGPRSGQPGVGRNFLWVVEEERKATPPADRPRG